MRSWSLGISITPKRETQRCRNGWAAFRRRMRDRVRDANRHPHRRSECSLPMGKPLDWRNSGPRVNSVWRHHAPDLLPCYLPASCAAKQQPKPPLHPRRESGLCSINPSPIASSISLQRKASRSAQRSRGTLASTLSTPSRSFGEIGWEIRKMRLYSDPRSPYLFYDFTYRGKRYRGSTDEKRRSAANNVATNHLAKLMAGDLTPRVSRRVPTLQEFSREFLAWAENSRTIEPNTVRYYQYGIRLLGFSELACIPIDQLDSRLIDTVKFRRPLINRSSGKPTGEWTDCGKTYTQQAQRTLRVFG